MPLYEKECVTLAFGSLAAAFCVRARLDLLVAYMPLGLNGALILCLDTRTAEQFREPADGSHARCFLVPIEVHSDADGALQPARQVAAEEPEAY